MNSPSHPTHTHHKLNWPSSSCQVNEDSMAFRAIFPRDSPVAGINCPKPAPAPGRFVNTALNTIICKFLKNTQNIWTRSSLHFSLKNLPSHYFELKWPHYRRESSRNSRVCLLFIDDLWKGHVKKQILSPAALDNLTAERLPPGGKRKNRPGDNTMKACVPSNDQSPHFSP